MRTVLLTYSCIYWVLHFFFFFKKSTWVVFVILWLVSCFFSLPLKKCNCAFMFPRNLTASKWEEPQKWPKGLYLNFAELRRGIKVWLGSVLPFLSGWYPGLVAAIELLLPTETADELCG